MDSKLDALFRHILDQKDAREAARAQEAARARGAHQDDAASTATTFDSSLPEGLATYDAVLALYEQLLASSDDSIALFKEIVQLLGNRI